MATRFPITITRPTGTGGHDPTSGKWLPGSVVEVWSGRADVIDDRLTLKQYTDGDEGLDDADLLIFLREKIFHQVDVQDQVRWTVAGEERYGVVLGSIEVASALIVQLVSKESQPLPSGLHISSNPVDSAAVGDAYSYTVTTADAEGPVTLTALSKPDWLTFTDLGNGTATLEGTPDQEDVGTVSITIQASDGVSLTAQAWVLTVQGGAPLYVASVEDPISVSPAMALGMKSAGLANDQTWGWNGITWVPYDLAGGMWDDIEDKPETATRWPLFSEIGGAAVFPPRAGQQLTGTVTLTAGSTTIQGNGTLFESEIPGPGEGGDPGVPPFVVVEGQVYEIQVVSDTELFTSPAPTETAVNVPVYLPTDPLTVQSWEGNTAFAVDVWGQVYIGDPENLPDAVLPVGGDIYSFGEDNALRLEYSDWTNHSDIRALEGGDLFFINNGGYWFQGDQGNILYAQRGATALNSNQPEAAFDVYLPGGHATPALQTRDTAGNPVFSIDPLGNVAGGLFNGIDVPQLKTDFDNYVPPTPEVDWNDLTGTLKDAPFVTEATTGNTPNRDILTWTGALRNGKIHQAAYNLRIQHDDHIELWAKGFKVFNTTSGNYQAVAPRGFTASSLSPYYPAISVKGQNPQLHDIFEIIDYAGNVMSAFGQQGWLAINTTDPTAQLDVQVQVGQVLPGFRFADSVGNALVEILPSGDVELMDSSIGIIQRSPDGTRWRTGVDNAGNFTATAL